MQFKFKKVFPNDYELGKVQDNFLESLKQVANHPLLGGVFIDAISLSTSDAIIEHKLGRIPKGYLVTDNNASAIIYTSSTTNTQPEKFIILKASASCIADLYFF